MMEGRLPWRACTSRASLNEQETATRDPGRIVKPVDAYVPSLRCRSPLVRVVAAVVLAAFVTVNIATAVYSLGVYCLTF